MDNSPYSDLKSSLSSVPAKALNYSSRLILGSNLDTKQVLPSKYGIARDYRGLAELMGFQYMTIRKFADSENPTMRILDTWETQPDATLDKLISFLEEMERYDVINEVIPLIQKNAQAFTRHQISQEAALPPVQVPEVTPGPISRSSRKGLLTSDDLMSGECTIYDAYVSYADEDCAYVNQFANFLELEIGFKLFIRGRDMLAGCPELDTNIELIKNRCRHMLIILTPNFITSPACEFQVSFAGSLAIEQKKRILIPVIVGPCEIPLILNGVSKIDFSKPHIQDWMWEKLITSLMPEDNRAVFLSRQKRMAAAPRRRALPPAAANNNPVITFPPTTKMHARPVDNSTTVPAITSAEVHENESKDIVASAKAIPPPPKKFHSIMSFFHRKSSSTTSSGSHSPSTSSGLPSPPTPSGSFSPSTSSGATSGFYSQTASEMEIEEIDEDDEIHHADTSL